MVFVTEENQRMAAGNQKCQSFVFNGISFEFLSKEPHFLATMYFDTNCESDN